MTQEEIRKCVLDILKKGHLLHLATIDDGGLWVSDLVYVYDDGLNIYWQSHDNYRHSRAILKNPNTAGTITISNKSKEPNECIQIAGNSVRIDGEVYELTVKDLTKRNHEIPPMGTKTLADGWSWYKFTPTKIDLIYEPLLGRGKEFLTL